MKQLLKHTPGKSSATLSTRLRQKSTSALWEAKKTSVFVMASKLMYSKQM